MMYRCASCISLWAVTLPMVLMILLLIFTSSSTSASAVKRHSWSPARPIRSLSFLYLVDLAPGTTTFFTSNMGLASMAVKAAFFILCMSTMPLMHL